MIFKFFLGLYRADIVLLFKKWSSCQELTDFSQITQVEDDRRPCISHIYDVRIKDHDQSLFKEERVYLGLKFQTESGGGMAGGGWSRRLRDRISSTTHIQQRGGWKSGEALNSHNLPQWLLTAQGCTNSQTAPLAGNHVSKSTRLWGTFIVQSILSVCWLTYRTTYNRQNSVYREVQI